jgi:hypothetical protein
MLIKWVISLVYLFRANPDNPFIDRHLKHNQCLRLGDERRPQPLRKSVQLHCGFLDNWIHHWTMGMVPLFRKLSRLLT